MNFDRWKDITELAGIVAIVASLIFVAIEVNQNTRALRAEAIQRSTEVAREQLLLLAENEDVVRISMTDLSELNDVERQRAFWINRSFMVGMQGLYRQWAMGVLPDEEWAFWTRVLCQNADSPRFREIWQPETLMPGLVDYVEASCFDS